MAGTHSRHASQTQLESGPDDEGPSVLGAIIDTRQIEAFGRKVTATASHLIGDESNQAYPSALSSLSQSMRRPGAQRAVYSLTRQAPSELVRSKLSTAEIAHRAITYIPDEQLANIPSQDHKYSLFQGFQASLPAGSSTSDSDGEHTKGHRRRGSKAAKAKGAGKEQKRLRAGGDVAEEGPPSLQQLKKKRNQANHRLEMIGIRKHMCSAEITEIDNKIANLNHMRGIVLDRLAALELDELEAENELAVLDGQVEDMQAAAAADDHGHDALAESTSTLGPAGVHTPESQTMDGSFMSESIYEKLPSATSAKSASVRGRPRTAAGAASAAAAAAKRKAVPVLHEHLEAGSSLKTLPAHNDTITALDFDVPFGTMVTAALDDTVRVWDLNLGRCMGFLEGHTASVRCLQIDDALVATGSRDATIRLWDLSRARYEPYEHKIGYTNPDQPDEEDDEAALGFGNEGDAPPPPPPDAMADCSLFTLEAHVDEITALHLRGDTLVSGSADKTLRQWDLVKGRCVQTLDVLWAAAQASATALNSPGSGTAWKPTSRTADANADFVGALQCFDAALACGTADGMVRLWDLRSGQVHRSLVGHTGPVTCLQFDDVHMVTGSTDRSIRIWDLRTGSIHDAFAYDLPITSMMFDARHIVSAAGEDVVKVYDKTDGRQWNCGHGATISIEERMEGSTTSIVERVRIKDGYLVEGRRDGQVGVWSC